MLSNIDKHRVIHAVAQSTVRVEATTHHGSLQLVEDTTGKGLPTFAIVPDDPEAKELHSEVTVTLSVLFSDSEDATNHRVVSTLRAIRARVAAVIDALEPYAV